jgi:Protein of unknown function (DUF2505)
MDVRGEINYPNADPERAFALSMDPQYRGAVCQATRALHYDVDVDQRSDDTATVIVRRTMPADVPDFVKKFIGETVDVVQTEVWAAADPSGQRRGRLTLKIEGQPAALTGTVSLDRVGDGARASIRGDLKVSMPFVGKKIEPEIAKGILAAIGKEQEVADKWLGAPG